MRIGICQKFMRRRVFKRILISFQVNIFFKDMYVKRTIETKEFPNTSSFMANLGGALSLYLGTSLIALFEILELLVRLLVSGVAYLFWPMQCGILKKIYERVKVIFSFISYSRFNEMHT